MDAPSIAIPREPPTKATAVAHCWVREVVYQELTFQSGRRREHPDAFAAKLLTAALLLGVADDLIDKAEAELQIR